MQFWTGAMSFEFRRCLRSNEKDGLVGPKTMGLVSGFTQEQRAKNPLILCPLSQ